MGHVPVPRIIHDIDDRGVNTERVLATIHNASPESVYTVLAMSDTDDDGRSQWLWFRLANGDLILGVFPQGETYFSCEVDASTPQEVDHGGQRN